jgi:hypothetical protein
MHLDFTVHFWSLVVQLATLASVTAFLMKVYKKIKSVVTAALLILAQHRAMHAWYKEVSATWPQKS